MTDIILRSQEYAQRAYNCVKQVKSESKDKYLTFAKRFPTLIHTCGLSQAVAFAASKDEYIHNLEDLGKVLGGEFNKLKYIEFSSIEFSSKVNEFHLGEYIRVSREALLAAGWLKLYAEGLLDKQGQEI